MDLLEAAAITVLHSLLYGSARGVSYPHYYFPYSMDLLEAAANEHPAKVMTFMVVFVSVFCGWPCLLHCMAGVAKTGRGRGWHDSQ